MIDSDSRLGNMGGMVRRKGQADGAAGLRDRGVTLSSGQGDTAVVLPRLGFASSPFRRLGVGEALRSPIAGGTALGVLVSLTVLVVLYASQVPSTLVQGSFHLFPGWLAGPLHGLLSTALVDARGHPIIPWQTVDYAFTAAIVVMFVAYGVALYSARALPMRAIAITIGVVYALLVLSPPLGLSDVFNYLGYARLEAHGLNPYTHVIADEHFDPVYMFATWRDYHSPYGQVFSILTYPLGLMSLQASYWVLKVGIVALMGVFVALVGKCARQLGHDPRWAVVFVALNPVVLLYDIGGFHNDPVVLVPMMMAISLLLARRYRWAGVAMAVAIGVKPTIVLLLPFLMIGAYPARKSLQVLLGTILGGLALLAVSVALFGFALPNVADQSIIVTQLSGVNLAGLALHLGGATPLVKNGAKVVLVVVVVALVFMALKRRRPDWISAAGWATIALLLCTAWLMPWYIVWALPLVALSTSIRLRAAMVVVIAYAAISFMPITAMTLGNLHVNLLASHADVVAKHRLWLFMH